MASETQRTHLVLPVSERDHSQGPADAPLTLVEYGDFECPYCGRAYPIVKEVQRHLGERLRFVFRNFPLTRLHRNAQLAAEAAEAAAAQGKYWAMHDTLFENQQHLSGGDLLRYARELHLNPSVFNDHLAGHTFAGRVREDFMSGVHSGVNGTPTFFINGVRYDGPHNRENLLAGLASAEPLVHQP